MASVSDQEQLDSTDSEGSSDLESSSPSVWKNWLNLFAYVVSVAANFMAAAGVFGASIGQVSNKYRTLVAPASWAFIIWGPIYLWEGVFAVAQLFPHFRQRDVVMRVTPWWWIACIAQAAWLVAFVQDQVTLATIFMLIILICLLGISWNTDGLHISAEEYFLLRGPFSLHLGWIIAASLVNISIQADAAKASQEVLLALAVGSNAAVLATVTAFTFAVRSPDPLIGFVAAWALAAISDELTNPAGLNDPDRFNPSKWDPATLGGLTNAALGLSVVALAFAVLATVLKVYKAHFASKSMEE